MINVIIETAGLKLSIIFFNSVLSTKNGKFMTIDIKNMNLNMNLKDFQFMKFNINIIPQEVINHYNLQDKVTADGWLYCEIQKAIYCLKVAGKLANIKLQMVLAKNGYKPYPFTQKLYIHATWDITISLVVDGFGIKYTIKANVDHLIACLTKSYLITTDWTRTSYIGIILKCDYNIIHRNQPVYSPIPGYVREILIEFNHHSTEPNNTFLCHHIRHQYMIKKSNIQILSTFTVK